MTERQSRGSSSDTQKAAPIIVRRKKGDDHGGHHGGAWKIAYADFVTAMMAFFLLMWLLGSTSKFDKQGIEDYFNAPLSSLLGGPEGTAVTRPNVINGGGRDISDTRKGEGKRTQDQPTPPRAQAVSTTPADLGRLQQLKDKLTALIESSPSLRDFKDQIRISITNEGLRIEIVDSLKRPMFPSGSSKLEGYATTILSQIGSTLNDVDNRISIAGHTDAVPYQQGPAGYSNWELSSERANAARRALVAGGMREDKLLQVRGLADVLPLDAKVADEPTNRRISILVLNKAAEQAFFSDGGRTEVGESANGAMPASSIIPAAVQRMQPVPAQPARPQAVVIPQPVMPQAVTPQALTPPATPGAS